MADYRLKPLKAEPDGSGNWRIGAEGAIVSGTVTHAASPTLPYVLRIGSEVAIGTHSEGNRPPVGVASLEEAVALVEAVRLEALLPDVEPSGVKQAFAALTDDERADIAAEYCHSCWRPDPGCRCWDDT